MFCQFEKLQNYNVKDGLPSSEVYGVMQDSKGYIWINGDVGVSRFNGYEFKNFSTENGLTDNTIFGIYEDKKGRIWFRSMSGKLAYFENNKMRELPCNGLLEKKMKGFFVTSIFVDKGDTIWLGTTRNFFIKIKPNWLTNCVEKIEMSAGKYLLKIDEVGFVFGGTSNVFNIITVYDKSRHRVFSVDPKITTKKNLDERFFLIQLKNGTYLSSIGNNLINFNSKRILAKKVENSVIIHLLEDSHRNLGVCTYKGLFFYKNGQLEKSKSIKQLNNKIITGIYQDMEDTYWITTEGHGVYTIPHRNILYYTTQNGISESKISCIGKHDSDVVIGHLDGTLNKLNKDSVKIVVSKYDPKMNTQTLRNTSISNYGNKTIVTSIGSVLYLDKTGLTYIPEMNWGDGARKFIRSNEGDIWGLFFNKIIKFDTKNKYKRMDSLNTGVRTDNLFEDSNGNLWICCTNGIYVYRNKKIDYLGTKNKLFTYKATYVSEMKDKSIWIATLGGGVVVKFGNKVIQITEREGLVGNMCRSLFIDSNIVWVGTNKGLSKISSLGNEKYNIENFYEKNGLLTNEVNSILKYDNKLWLAHNNGVSVFDVGNIRPNNYPPPVYILQTLVNDSLYKEEDLMNLKNDHNYLTINYVGLTYKNVGKVEYKYKIEGIDSNWIYTNYTTVSFHTVPPGSYKFLVYAKNNDGYWSSVPATVRFTILPPWWQTWIFILVATTVLAFAISFAFIYRLRFVKKREQLKAIQQTRLFEAELKALRSQMNPHFVFNAINSVQYFITNNDPVSSQKYLSKFAKLIRYVVDNSKPSAIPLNKELEALRLYLDLESLRFENKFEYSIDINNNVDLDSFKIPSMLIQPYVENAIWHGLMHKTTKGKIKIEVLLNKNILICVIEDNGIGRKRSQEIIKEKDNEFHKSVGMSITQERLAVINQQNNSNLTVSVIDLMDENGNAKGTRVELNLPFY